MEAIAKTIYGLKLDWKQSQLIVVAYILFDRELLKNPLIISYTKTPISYKAPVIEFQVAFPVVSVQAGIEFLWPLIKVCVFDTVILGRHYPVVAQWLWRTEALSIAFYSESLVECWRNKFEG